MVQGIVYHMKIKQPYSKGAERRAKMKKAKTARRWLARNKWNLAQARVNRSKVFDKRLYECECALRRGLIMKAF